jgi:DNA polymerase III gamma/tau subunit
MLRVVRAIAARDYDTLYAQIDEVVQSAKDLAVFWQDLVSIYRDIMVVKTTPNYARYLDLTDEESRQLCEVSKLFTKETVLYHQRLLDNAFITMQGANALKRVTAEITLTRMCDEALNTTNEALLSRIARLEEQMMTGAWRRTEVSIPTESSHEPAEVQLSEPEAPVEQPDIVPTEEPTHRKVSAQKEQKPAEGMRVLRPIRCWAEVVQRLTAQDPMIGSFAKNIRAYQSEGGQVHLRFENDFAKMMMDKDDTKDMLRGAISVCLQREVREKDLVIETVPKTPDGCAIDEIIEALEETDQVNS